MCNVVWFWKKLSEVIKFDGDNTNSDLFYDCFINDSSEHELVDGDFSVPLCIWIGTVN